MLAGWHLHTLEDKAKQLKEEKQAISLANDKINKNSIIDTKTNLEINKIITDNNIKFEPANEKDNNCVIPSKWLQYLRTASH